MNTRFGSRLPPGVSQPPRFSRQLWDQAPPGRATPEQQRSGSTPLIRNPRLRQYYLQGPSQDVSRTQSVVSPGVGAGSLHLDSAPQQKKPEADQPSPEGEYDTLLDVEAVPTPDGQLYLLALPPECCEGAGPEATPYLKLFCSYITDRKGVVSGLLLVTSQKLFFDPSKTHPLVEELGCEHYLLSCCLERLHSVTFYQNISHLQFSSGQQSRKQKNIFHKLKSSRRNPAPPDPRLKEEELHPAPPDPRLKEEELHPAPPDPSLKAESSSEQDRPSANQRPAAGGSATTLMFVRLRVESCSGGGRSGGRLHLGTDGPSSRMDAWLALSQESAHQLQAYLKRCRPHLRLHLQLHPERDEEDLVLVEDGTAAAAAAPQKPGSSADDWEMVSMDDGGERPPPPPEPDPEGLQQVLDSSHILEASHVQELLQELPARTEGGPWRLSFSSSRHGSSLQTLYRKLQSSDSPALLLIKDALDEVFGAFLSHPLRPSEEFYGTGETFLFMLHPRFKCFRWTGENSFFIKGFRDSFAIGGGSGHFGLWLDENLYLGHSSPCYTFNNCCLSETNDFRVMELEVWTFS